MGTRSAIAFRDDNGRITGKYSHYDGYPSYTGAILDKHYKDDIRVFEMVQLGDQSGIAPEYMPNGEHSFNNPEEGVTVFYGRDRGEQDVGAQSFDTIAEFVEYYKGAGCEYFYIWDGVEWIFNDHAKQDAAGNYIFDFLELALEAA